MSIMPQLDHPDLSLVVEPTNEPVTVDELRDDHLRLINVTIEANKIKPATPGTEGHRPRQHPFPEEPRRRCRV